MDTDEGFLLVVIGLLLAASVLMVVPYLQFVLAAVVLGFVLQPLQGRLSRYVGRTAAAAVLVVVSVVALVFPFFLAVTFVASDVRAFVSGLEQQDLNFAFVEDPIAEYTGVEVDVGEIVRSSAADVSAFDGALSLFGTLTHLLLGIGLLLFLLFFFVRDGRRLVAWLRRTSPLPTGVVDELLARLDSITRAVLAGHVLVAVIQGLLAGVGLAATDIPNYVFWTFVMVVLGLIPLIGSFVVWAPASLYLFFVGRPVAGVALFVYGSTVVAVSDDYIRPIVVDRYARVSPSIIIVGVLGGLSVFGFMGLFVGPVVVAALKETVEVYDDHYGYPSRSPNR